jgi:hypothetical protein
MLVKYDQSRGMLARMLADARVRTVPGMRPSVILTKMGVLYIIAAFVQAGWPIYVGYHHDIALRYAGLPVLGWVMAIVWIAMAWLVIHLSYIGINLVRLSRDPDVLIAQTEADKKKKMGRIAVLLMLGILADLIAIPIAVSLEDQTAGVYLSVLMGARVVQANMEAVLQYHGR